MKLQIMSPAADRVDYKVPPAPRLSSLEGKTIGLYNNMTGGADIAVERVAEHLSRRYPNVKFERYGGDRQARPPGAQPGDPYRCRGGGPNCRGGGRRDRRHRPLRRMHVVACP